MSARENLFGFVEAGAQEGDLPTFAAAIEAFRAEVLADAGETLIGLGYEAAGQLLRDTADVVRAPAARCDVTFVGGGQCTKASGHRTLANQDPHTPAAAPVPDETAGDKTGEAERLRAEYLNEAADSLQADVREWQSEQRWRDGEGDSRGPGVGHAITRLRDMAVYREVWDSGLPPGGFVCNICGQPVESEPCPDHAPAVPAETADVEPETTVEFGVRVPYDVLLTTTVREDADTYLGRLRDMYGDDAVLVQRTVHYGPWTEVAR